MFDIKQYSKQVLNSLVRAKVMRNVVDARLNPETSIGLTQRMQVEADKVLSSKYPELSIVGISSVAGFIAVEHRPTKQKITFTCTGLDERDPTKVRNGCIVEAKQ